MSGTVEFLSDVLMKHIFFNANIDVCIIRLLSKKYKKYTSTLESIKLVHLSNEEINNGRVHLNNIINYMPRLKRIRMETNFHYFMCGTIIDNLYSLDGGNISLHVSVGQNDEIDHYISYEAKETYVYSRHIIKIPIGISFQMCKYQNEVMFIQDMFFAYSPHVSRMCYLQEKHEENHNDTQTKLNSDDLKRLLKEIFNFVKTKKRRMSYKKSNNIVYNDTVLQLSNMCLCSKCFKQESALYEYQLPITQDLLKRWWWSTSSFSMMTNVKLIANHTAETIVSRPTMKWQQCEKNFFESRKRRREVINDLTRQYKRRKN